MMNPKQTFLVDTSIQIARLTTMKWRRGKLDYIWDEIEPVTCCYSFREFKSAVIGALEFLISILEEIPDEHRNGDGIKVRLSDIVRQALAETIHREGERRMRMACVYAAILLDESAKESELFTPPRPQTVEELTLKIQCDALNLQDFGFFEYGNEHVSGRMKCEDVLNCDGGKRENPFPGGYAAYNCRKSERPCDVVMFLNSSKVSAVANAIATGALRVRDSRLRTGAAAIVAKLPNHAQGKSIGMNLCFPLGDIILVCKADACEHGMFTIDRDQSAIANYLQIPLRFYDVKSNAII